MRKFLRLTASVLAFFISISMAAFPSSAAAPTTDKLIDMGKISSDIVIDLRYATENNFTGIKLYPSSICCLQEDTAWKLEAANREVMKSGFRIKVWDAYRPLSVQKKMWEIMPDPGFLANPYKNGSKHNRGAAVDVTLVDKDGKEAEMPSGFDEFTYRAARNNSRMSAAAAKNLKILTDAMVKSGFKSISTEWWHFDDAAAANYPLLDVSPETIAGRPLPIEELKCAGDSKQVLLVTGGGTAGSKAVLSAYEKVDGKWLKVLPDMNAFIGKNGFKRTKNSPLSAEDKKTYKYEGDGCSPMGVFTVGALFGWGPDPGFKLPYKTVTADDYWVSGDEKELYNVWINRKGGPDKSWKVYEKLKIPDYKYAAVIDYNIGADRVVGNGSAIFLHIADSRGYTSGCTAVSEPDLLKVLKWLRPEMSPIIIQGTPEELKRLPPLPVQQLQSLLRSRLFPGKLLQSDRIVGTVQHGFRYLFKFLLDTGYHRLEP